MKTYKTLLAARMNFFQRIIWRIRYDFSPQVTVVRKRAMDYAVLTRKNKWSEWTFREMMKNKHTDQVLKLVHVKYPEHLFFMPKEAFKKAARAQNKEAHKRADKTMTDY